MTQLPLIDLRSDTVTQPTDEMRAAMSSAEVGDDVMGEDPTVNMLQEMAAERMEKEAGLFVPSGTMGNLAAVLAHCGRGDELIVGDQAHTFRYEAGGTAALAGVHSFVIPNQADGSLSIEHIRNAVREDDPHCPTSRLLLLENTQNRCGGTVLGVEYMDEVGNLAAKTGLKIHVDGARIFNAAVALRIPAADLVRRADSVTFCLSKGLCAPVGSVLCGTREFIGRALRARKQLGGGMRQAGILAAAGIVALEKMTSRLGEDHALAHMLAAKLAAVPGVCLDNPVPATNMVFFTLADTIAVDADAIAQRLIPYGVLVFSAGPRRFRLVTHYGVDGEGVERVVGAFRAELAKELV